MTRFILSAALLSFVLIPQLKSQTIVAVPFDQLEASQYNIGLNGVKWSQSSTLSNFFKLYTTGWLNGVVNTNRPGNYYGPGSEGILNYASNNAPPSIYGVNGFDASTNVQHLLDNHHRVSGLYLLTTIFTNGYSATVTVTNASGTVITTTIGAAPDYTFVNQTADWSSMLPTVFWSNMLAGTGDTNFAPVSTNANGFWSTTNQPTYLWAYNLGVYITNPITNPPPMIPGLTDDTLRDVAAQVNYPTDYGFTLKGYQNRDDAEQLDIQGDDGNGLVLYFQEFWWANYLRPYVYLIPTGSNISTAGMNSNAPYQFTDYSQLIAFSADFLCHSTNAANLPGYYDSGLTSVDFPEFRPGSTVLIGPSGALNVSGNMIIDNGATLTVKGALTVTNETFYVGKDTANNTMVITNGGVVTNSNSVIGYAAAATNNSVLVTGAGSTLTNSRNLTIGDSGSGNSLVVSNGGTVINGGQDSTGGVIGFNTNSSNNSVLVTGSDSAWLSAGDVVIGYSGTGNRLEVSNGGTVSNGVVNYAGGLSGGIIGFNSGSTDNSVLVTGTGSQWISSGDLFVGFNGAGNSMVISNGGSIFNSQVDFGGVLGWGAGSSNNTVLVTDAGSSWTNSGNLIVGYAGSSNSLIISNGGTVAVASDSLIGYGSASSNNSVLVTDVGSLWTNSGGLYVGYDGSGNTMKVANAGTVVSFISYIGNSSISSNNSVLVTGTSSALNTAILGVGYDGSGNSLVIADGGTVAVASFDSFIGYGSTSSNNSLLVTGTSSLWTNHNGLFVGHYGSSNSLVISNGGTVAVASDSLIGWDAASSNNSVVVTGPDSLWTNSGYQRLDNAGLVVGYEGSGNSLIISNGGMVAVVFDSLIGYNAVSSNNSVLVTGTNSIWTNSGNLYVGYAGSSNSLVISNGGTVAVASDSLIGWRAASSNNSVVVTGPDSLWTNSGYQHLGNAGLVVGYEGSGNSLIISNGGTVAVVFDSLIGYDAVSSNNSVLVTGLGSTWTNSDSLEVGRYGSGNSLVISNDAKVFNATGYIGSASTAVGNLVTVTGSNSSWINSGDLYVGYEGSGNRMIISNGGTVSDQQGYIGYTNGSSNNSVLVTGANSLWTNSGDLYVGNFGSDNSLMISNGGKVFNAMGYIGSASTAVRNLVTVTGSNSSWINSGDLYVGFAGQSNRLVISDGGLVSNVNGFDDGVDPTDAYNSVLVTGAGSRWSNSGSLTFGLAGHDNSLVISNGGNVTVGVDSKIGDLATASNNSVLVTGPSSIWTNSGTLYVGNYASGNSLVISNGGRVLNAGSSYISFRDISSNNSVHVTGSGSSLVSQFALGIGAFGAGNTLTISDGASVSNAYAAIGVGSLASNNSVLVTGSNSTWRSSDSLAIGGGGLYYPSGGSSWNSLTISNGASVYAGRGFIGSLDSSNNSVLVTGARSLWSISTNLVVGYSNSSHNSLVISNGGRVNSSVADIGFAATSTGNSVLITGTGSAWSNSGSLTIGVAGSGTLTVANGGVLSASRILIGTNGDLDFGRYQQNDTAGNVVTTTIEFTGTNSDDYGINFNQSDTLHLTSSIIGAGWVCQLGSGTSVMSGSNSYSLYTKIDAGTLVAASTNALGTGSLGIGGYADRATLALATNLIVGDFTWGSNGVVALTAGSQTLTVAGMTNSAGTNNGANVFRFLNTDLSNATNTLINYTSLAGFTTNSFSVSGISGYSFSTDSNKVSAYLSTSANVAVSNSVTINGTLTVNSLTVDPSGTLMGSGTLSLTGGNLNLNGTIAPGNSPGTFYVSGGNLVMGSTATWDQQIYSTSVYDRVVVAGAAFLNGTMNITSYGSGGLEYGQKFNFLTASGGISGAFSSIIAPNGFRGRLLLSGNNTEANILIAPSSYTLLAQGKNQNQVAAALDSFIPATSGDRLVISTSLDSLTASQYAQAFNAIMPTMYQSMATIAFNQANALNMQLNQRLWGLRLAEGGGFSMSGMDNMPMLEGQGDSADKGVLDSKKDILRPGADNHWGMFVDANGIFANANSGNMLPGYNAQSGGINAGLTYKWNDSFASGIYCGYQGTYSKMGANGSGLGTGSSLIDNAVRFGVFGTYGQKDGKGLYANALVGGAYHNYQATRVIQYTGMNRTANSAPGAGELDTMLATGYDIQKGKFTFGPTASLQYTYLGVNPVNETGAQSLNFNSGGWNSSSMLSSVGAHAAYNWQAGKNVVVVPQISLNWQHEFLQNPYDITGNLGGTSPTFSNTSATGIRDYLYTGVGFTVELNKKWNTSFFYNAAAGNSDLVSQNIFWSAGVKF